MRQLDEEHFGLCELRAAIAQWDDGRQQITVWVDPYSDEEVDRILDGERKASETPVS